MQRIKETSEMLYWTVIAVVVLGILAFGTLFIQSKVYPWWLEIQRNAVEESKSFVDSRNDGLITMRQEYLRLEEKAVAAPGEVVPAYRAQQKAILDDMCQIVETMQPDTVATSINQFLALHGGCK